MEAETVGQALSRMRHHRHLSLRQLGKLVTYSHVYIWEIEKGTKPPAPEFIAACDSVLHAGGHLIALAAQQIQRNPAAPDEGVGLAFATDWSEGIAAVTTLWTFDAGRRRLLHNAAYVSSALTLQVQQWLDHAGQPTGNSDNPEVRACRPGEILSAEDIRTTTRMFRRLDNLYGGGQIRPAVLRYLDGEVAPMLRGKLPEELGTSLLSATAELTQLAGSHVLALDVDQACGVGHQALDLAGQMSSARAITYIDRLIRDLKPWRTDARVKEFVERARLVTAQE